MNAEQILRRATFSPCERYRYTLPRIADPATADRLCLFVCLNPSTADDMRNDPSVTRMVGYAQRWGFDGLLVGNAYAYRSTDPAALRRVWDPIGPDNDAWLTVMAKLSALTVIAWGTNCAPERAEAVRSLLVAAGTRPHYLKLTKGGEPWHPLYLPKKLGPLPWESRPRRSSDTDCD
jgi:hypothetical protein